MGLTLSLNTVRLPRKQVSLFAGGWNKLEQKEAIPEETPWVSQLTANLPPDCRHMSDLRWDPRTIHLSPAQISDQKNHEQI